MQTVRLGEATIGVVAVPLQEDDLVVVLERRGKKIDELVTEKGRLYAEVRRLEYENRSVLAGNHSQANEIARLREEKNEQAADYWKLAAERDNLKAGRDNLWLENDRLRNDLVKALTVKPRFLPPLGDMTMYNEVSVPGVQVAIAIGRGYERDPELVGDIAMHAAKSIAAADIRKS